MVLQGDCEHCPCSLWRHITSALGTMFCLSPRDVILHSCWLTGTQGNDTHVLPLFAPVGALGSGIYQRQQWDHPSIIADLECLDTLGSLAIDQTPLKTPLRAFVSGNFTHIHSLQYSSKRESMGLGFEGTEAGKYKYQENTSKHFGKHYFFLTLWLFSKFYIVWSWAQKYVLLK